MISPTSGCRTTSFLSNRTTPTACSPPSLRTASARPDGMPGGRSVWVGSPVIDHTGVLAHAGEEHLHLRRRGVLRLVEDDVGAAQRPAAHVGQGRDLDLAGLDPLLQLALGQHVLQRVVERPHVGIDLLLEVARQEAQALAGLDRRAATG